MTQMSKIDKKGGMEINEELVRFFYNYTIKEKKGFFLLDKNAYMKIKKIFPVHYPLSPA